jgi:hypothetical protein
MKLKIKNTLFALLATLIITNSSPLIASALPERAEPLFLTEKHEPLIARCQSIARMHLEKHNLENAEGRKNLVAIVRKALDIEKEKNCSLCGLSKKEIRKIARTAIFKLYDILSEKLEYQKQRKKEINQIEQDFKEKLLKELKKQQNTESAFREKSAPLSRESYRRLRREYFLDDNNTLSRPRYTKETIETRKLLVPEYCE